MNAAVPSPITSAAVARMNGLDFMTALMREELPPPPFAPTTEIWPLAVDEGRAVFHGKPAQRFYNPMGTVHGGWLSTLLDTAMGCAVHTRLPAGMAYTTVEMKLNFVKPAFEHTGTLRCEATLIHFGKRIATSEGRVYDAAGNLIAHGTETCMIFPAPPARTESHPPL